MPGLRGRAEERDLHPPAPRSSPLGRHLEEDPSSCPGPGPIGSAGLGTIVGDLLVGILAAWGMHWRHCS